MSWESEDYRPPTVEEERQYKKLRDETPGKPGVSRSQMTAMIDRAKLVPGRIATMKDVFEKKTGTSGEPAHGPMKFVGKFLGKSRRGRSRGRTRYASGYSRRGKSSRPRKARG